MSAAATPSVALQPAAILDRRASRVRRRDSEILVRFSCSMQENSSTAYRGDSHTVWLPASSEDRGLRRGVASHQTRRYVAFHDNQIALTPDPLR